VPSLGPHFAQVTVEEVHDERIQEHLFMSQLQELYQFKILVLGAGESGKSTVVKQLRFIHKNQGLTDRELKRIKETLAENVFDCFKSLVEATKTLNIPIIDEQDKKTAEMVLDESVAKTVLNESIAAQLSNLWRSDPMQKAYENRDKFWILDSVDYFMENVQRFAEETFEPSEEDVVMARVRTTGIVTTEFDQRNVDGKEEWNKNIHYQVIDVGGQRSERKKWINCFDNVKAILFVSNLAGYNMVLYEDEEKNRLHECLELFKDTVNLDIFKNTPIFLFLNKKDLFEDKIRKTDLSFCFPDYKGGQELKPSLEYVSQKFREQVPPGNLHQYRDFFIASRVKRDVKYAFEDLQADLLRMNKERIEAAEKKILVEAKFQRANF